MQKSSRHPNTFNSCSCTTEYFENTFYPSVFSDWNKFNLDVHGSNNYSVFQYSLVKFIRPAEMKTKYINDSVGINLLTR